MVFAIFPGIRVHQVMDAYKCQVNPGDFPRVLHTIDCCVYHILQHYQCQPWIPKGKERGLANSPGSPRTSLHPKFINMQDYSRILNKSSHIPQAV